MRIGATFTVFMLSSATLQAHAGGRLLIAFATGPNYKRWYGGLSVTGVTATAGDNAPVQLDTTVKPTCTQVRNSVTGRRGLVANR